MYYFVGGKVVDNGFEEAGDFAINGGKGWSDCVFENPQIEIKSDVAFALGTYYLTDATFGDEVKFAYTFGYERCVDGKVRIFLHHSSGPFQLGPKKQLHTADGPDTEAEDATEKREALRDGQAAAIAQLASRFDVLASTMSRLRAMAAPGRSDLPGEGDASCRADGCVGKAPNFTRVSDADLMEGALAAGMDDGLVAGYAHSLQGRPRRAAKADAVATAKAETRRARAVPDTAYTKALERALFGDDTDDE